MAEYPNNSHAGREGQTDKSGSPPERKLDKVVSGGTKTRKKSEVKKFAGIFVPEDTDSVKSYILTDVVIPGIKNAIADVVSIVLFGEIKCCVGRNGKYPLLVFCYRSRRELHHCESKSFNSLGC